MFDQKIFGDRLSRVRTARGISRKEFADYLQVTKTQISDLENGKTGTNLTRLTAICEYYQVSSDYLLGITDDPTWRGKELGSDEGNAGFEAGTATDRGTM